MFLSYHLLFLLWGALFSYAKRFLHFFRSKLLQVSVPLGPDGVLSRHVGLPDV